jgi:Bpu10I restriction endonuclease
MRCRQNYLRKIAEPFDRMKNINVISPIALPSRSRMGNISALRLPEGNLLAGLLQRLEQCSTPYLRETVADISHHYGEWQQANNALIGPFYQEQYDDCEILRQRTELLNEFSDLLDGPQYVQVIPPKSKFRSSMLQEFIHYLFRDLVGGFAERALIGKSHTFKDIFFMPPNYDAMLASPHARIEKKDHDFAIGVSVSAILQSAGQEKGEAHHFQIPAVAIECKTYLDKTMLEGASMAAEQLKFRNPNALYLVVSEWLKLTENVNLRKFKVDQIYVLRKQKNTDREYRFLPGYKKNPIYLDAVEHLFNTVRTHLTSDWESGVGYGLQRGYLL